MPEVFKDYVKKNNLERWLLEIDPTSTTRD